MNKYCPTPLLLDLNQVLQLTGITEKNQLTQMIKINSFPNHERYGQIMFWSHDKIKNWIKNNKKGTKQ